jgi:hypothetical protein
MLNNQILRNISLVALFLFLGLGLGGAGCSSSTTTTNQSSSEPVSIQPTNIQVGMNVAIAYEEGTNMYFATVTSGGTDDTYNIKYFSGGNAYADKVLVKYVVPAKLDLKVGDEVYAVKSADGDFYAGKIKEVKAGSYVVTWNEDATDEEVLFGRLLPKNLMTYFGE